MRGSADVTSSSSSMMWWSNDRHLYDEDFLDADCDADIVPFDEDTNVDSLLWTYLTNYFIWINAWAFAMVLLCKARSAKRRMRADELDPKASSTLLLSKNSSSSSGQSSAPLLLDSLSSIQLMACYFVVIGYTFGIAGIGHQIITSKESIGQAVFVRLTSVGANMSGSILLYIAASISLQKSADGGGGGGDDDDIDGDAKLQQQQKEQQQQDETQRNYRFGVCCGLTIVGIILTVFVETAGVFAGIVIGAAGFVWLFFIYAIQAFRIRNILESLDAIHRQHQPQPQQQPEQPNDTVQPQHFEDDAMDDDAHNNNAISASAAESNVANEETAINDHQYNASSTSPTTGLPSELVSANDISNRLIMKSTGILLLGVGTILQITLSSTCGKGGYETCFEDCPLPTDPTVFNHNAWFHVIYHLGTIIWGLAEIALPSTSSLEIIQYQLRRHRH